jgi:hypothetical protein
MLTCKFFSVNWPPEWSEACEHSGAEAALIQVEDLRKSGPGLFFLS